MYPILFEYGNLIIYAYGIFVALGFFLAFWVGGRMATRLGQDPRRFRDLGLVVLIASLVGARLFYVLLNWEIFAAEPLAVFHIWSGGMVYHGGLVFGAVAGWLFLRGTAPANSALPLADAAAPAIALGHAVGRLACLFAGCCYGKATELFCAVTFTDPRSLARLDTPLHPTQLYEVFANLLIFGLLIRHLGRAGRHPGSAFGLYLILYGVARFVIEFFRGDTGGGGFIGPLSIAQWTSIALLAVGGWLFWSRPSPQNN